MGLSTANEYLWLSFIGESFFLISLGSASDEGLATMDDMDADLLSDLTCMIWLRGLFGGKSQ
jgi:hypothetical protein